MPPSDDELLYDIVDFAREALDFAAGRTFDDLTEDRALELILTKLVENVGEAASQLSQARRAAIPGVPWRDIIGMRHRIVHGYRDVDLNVVWEVVDGDLPRLLAMLEPVVERVDQQSEARESDD
jgi:uncharacterized protein with HEPN domain